MKYLLGKLDFNIILKGYMDLLIWAHLISEKMILNMENYRKHTWISSDIDKR